MALISIGDLENFSKLEKESTIFEKTTLKLWILAKALGHEEIAQLIQMIIKKVFDQHIGI